MMKYFNLNPISSICNYSLSLILPEIGNTNNILIYVEYKIIVFPGLQNDIKQFLFHIGSQKTSQNFIIGLSMLLVIVFNWSLFKYCSSSFSNQQSLSDANQDHWTQETPSKNKKNVKHQTLPFLILDFSNKKC